VIGPKKSGDFTQQAILAAYEQLITARVPNALLAAFSTYSRYSGPREAVFTALCRKNFGCTHFVMGRDHTGVGNFYSADGNRELFESLGDFGIKPVFFDPIHYSPETGTTVESREPNGLQPISGSLIRSCLVENKPIPESLMSPDISSLLVEMIKSGQQVFVP
jgi:ATP sulfurylase